LTLKQTLSLLSKLGLFKTLKEPFILCTLYAGIENEAAALESLESYLDWVETVVVNGWLKEVVYDSVYEDAEDSEGEP
jgi:hypothetical protein